MIYAVLTDMHDFYPRHVHSHLIAEPDAALERYRLRIARELVLQGLTKEWVRGKTVFDIGTGYQAVVFAELGAARVFHMDISLAQVAHTESLGRKLGIRNLITFCGDAEQGLGPAEGIDLGFIYGVWHHMRQPSRLFFHLMQRVNPGARLLLRIYRSGTWSRWLVARMRTLYQGVTADDLLSVWRRLFPLDNDPFFLGDMLDDLYVPVWGAYHPAPFIAAAERQGCVCHGREESFHVDFGPRDENFRLHLELPNYVNSVVPEGCDQPVDQWKLVDKEIDALWPNYSERLSRMTIFERSVEVISLYRLVRSHAMFDYFSLSEYPKQQMVDGLAQRRRKGLISLLSRGL